MALAITYARASLVRDAEQLLEFSDFAKSLREWFVFPQRTALPEVMDFAFGHLQEFESAPFS